MTAVWAICRRDLIQHFTTPLAWLILAVWTFLTNGAFYLSLSQTKAVGASGWPLFDASVLVGSWSLILLAPAITMNSFASERSQGTMQLLCTVPIRDSSLVLGKFAASFGMLLALTAALLPQPIILAVISQVHWPQVCSAFLGLVLLAAFFAALGTWISILVDSTVAAYVLTLGIAAVLFLGGLLLADPSAGIWSGVSATAAFLGIEPHLAPLRRGDVALADAAYFLCFAAIFLILAHGSLQARRSYG